jgi:hypothetical protein
MLPRGNAKGMLLTLAQSGGRSIYRTHLTSTRKVSDSGEKKVLVSHDRGRGKAFAPEIQATIQIPILFQLITRERFYIWNS